MTKKFFFTLLFAVLIIPLSISAQEFDEKYLDSLPESVREDVLNRKDLKDQSEKPTYRRASTTIDKDEDDESEDGVDENLTVLFGKNFFDTMQSSFMPINEPNLDSSYILDFGDEIEIQLIGQKSSIETFSILRDGSINLADIGKIVISGLSIGDASDLIKAKVENAYVGTNAFITLKNVRDISILIAGNAFNPGIYTLNGNSNMLHALTMAGGINDLGSYRNIHLIRKGIVIQELDIYDVLINGNYSLSPGLRSGDSIVVRPIEKTIAIESGVKRPALYELKEDENYRDVIKFSNGYSQNADKKNIVLKRLKNGTSEVFNFNYESIEDFDLIDNDSIFIKEFKTNKVTILGAINNPGTYNLSQGLTLSSLINLAGGYTDFAYPFGGFLENKKALKINQDAKNKLYDTFIDNLILNSTAVTSDQNALGMLTQQIKQSKPSGRVIAEFDIDVIKNDPTKDTLLEDGDKIMIPFITQQVFVQGEVSNPGAIRYVPGKKLDYYIDKSGGVLTTSDKNNLFIVHPNGETENFASSKRLSFLASNTNSQLIYPGSIIYVPQTTDFASSAQVASIWAPIISSIALSLTSLSVLNNSN